MELQGKVIAALPERSGVSARGEWKAQEFVIEYQEGQYPRHLVFNVWGADRLQRFNIQIGQTVLVAFDIDAREWNGRWFTDIRAFDVRQVDPNAVMAQAAPQTQPAPFPQPTAAPAADANPAAPFPPQQEAAAGESADDLPF
ncbi:MAG: DUF3127 domain-containing protein [Prevotellaceae bacterium]|nr:DUF3127 domain-containing protein [Prevotellaceae bacterium]